MKISEDAARLLIFDRKLLMLGACKIDEYKDAAYLQQDRIVRSQETANLDGVK